MHLEIVLPQIPQIFTDFTDFIYPRIRVHLCYLWEILSHPISVLICDICGSHPLLLGIYSPTDSTDIHRFYISQNPCSSVLSVGDSFAPNICVNLRYLWEPPSAAWDLFSHGFHRYSQILYIPISVFICAIRGKHLRTQYLCSSAISVGDFLCCLRFILPRIPQIFTDFIYPISVFICAICGRFLRTTMEALIPSSTARCGLCADPLPLLSPQRAGVASPRRSGPSRSGRRVARYAPVRRDEHLRPRSNRTPLCW